MSDGRRRLTLRRRLDASALRWQARLDTPWVDRSLPWLIAGGLFVLLTAIGFAVQRQLDGGPTLAVWTQAAWNLEEGRGAVSSLAGGDVITDQWAFASLPLLVLARWIPMGALVAVAQPLCLALAVVPIWRMAREVARLRLGATVALCSAYAAAPILYTANLNGWSAVVPAVPALAWATWFGQRRRWVWYSVCVVIALLARADVGLVLVFFGILGVSSGDRRSGILTGALGAVWTAAFLVSVAPPVPQASSGLTAAEAVLARGTSPLAVLQDPLRLATDLVLQPNVGALIFLVGPFLFLPLVVPRFALPALPVLVLGLVGEEAVRQATEPGLPEPPLPSVLLLAVPFLAFATVVALSRIGTQSVARIRVDHRIVAAMVLATITIFVQVAPASPFNEPWSWGGRDAVDGGRMQAVDVLEEDDPSGPLWVSPQMTPMVAERRHLREMPAGPPGDDWWPRGDAILLDTTAVGDDGGELWDPGEAEMVVDRLVDADYEVRYAAVGIFVLVWAGDR